MNKVITYQNPETGIASIVIPSKSFIKSGRDIQELIDKLPPECKTTADIVDKQDIPTDRTFRNAWVSEKGLSVKTDMTKAKELVKENLREIRAPILSKLDVEALRADEEKDTVKKDAVVGKKQKARDATKDARISSAQTEVELKQALNDVIDDLKLL